MHDLISRQAAIDAILHNQEVYSNNFGNDAIDKYTIAIIDNDAQTIAQLPSAQPERKTGMWIPQDHNRRNGYVTTTVYFYPKCSECGYSGSYGMNYCPSCGAYMGGGEDEAD